MTKTISAYEARKSFGELLNLVAYGGYTYVVEKHGVPLAEIGPTKRKKSSRAEAIAKYRGIWVGKKGEEIEKRITEFRKNFKFIRA